MSFSYDRTLRPVPGAFLNTPAVASRFESGSDPVRRQLFPASSNNQPGGQVGGNLASGGLGTTGDTGRWVQLVRSSTALTAVNTGDAGLVAANPLPTPRLENVPPVLKAAKAINAFLQMDESFRTWILIAGVRH